MRFVPLTLSILLIAAAANLSAQEEATRPQLKPAVPPSIVWVNQPKEKQVIPEGVTHHTFHSKVVDREIGYCIYLPPDYEDFPDKRYPVIYTLHGNGGNEYTVIDSATRLHQGIEEGKWPSMIQVFPNGGHSTFYKDSHDGEFPIETIFITEFIPYIDGTYRTMADRSSRCIEGFSMGGRGSTRLYLKYPDLFCSLFCQAGNVPHILDSYDPSQPDTYPNALLGPDRKAYEENDVYNLIQVNQNQLRKEARILIACGSKDPGHLGTIRDFHAALLEANVDHTYIELEDLNHNRVKFLQQIGAFGIDYHVESMRRAGAKLPDLARGAD